MPIEDPYLDDTNNSALGPLAYQPIPFSQSGNPIMSTVTFLASVVDPRVAIAAAKVAISELSKIKDEVPPQVMDSHLSSISQMVKDGKKIDSSYNIEQTGVAIINSSDGSSSSSSVTVVESSAEINNKDSNKMEIDTQSQNEKLAIEKNNSSSSSSSSSSITDNNQINGNSENSVIKVESTVLTTLTTTTTTTISQQKENINENEIKSAAASVLAAAAVSAENLSLIEEKKIKSAVAHLVETQLKKLEIKLRHFEELEALMDKERDKRLNINENNCYKRGNSFIWKNGSH